MDASSLLAVIGQLQADGISVWIDGGWGVDALLGHQTREHDDLDLVIELDDATRVMGLLGSLGYEMVAGAPPKSFVMVDSRGRQVDLHPVTFDSDGGGVYEMDYGTEWVYPAEGFSGRGSVDGTPVHCLSPAVQVLVHRLRTNRKGLPRAVPAVGVLRRRATRRAPVSGHVRARPRPGVSTCGWAGVLPSDTRCKGSSRKSSTRPGAGFAGGTRQLARDL
jgi:lincosamide nucleotidyltransferase A/C/D/E